MNETEEFNLMRDFLTAMSPEIEAREAAPLSDNERQLLGRIALGESTDDDRTEALSMLTDNSTALEYLADQLNQG